REGACRSRPHQAARGEGHRPEAGARRRRRGCPRGGRSPGGRPGRAARRRRPRGSGPCRARPGGAQPLLHAHHRPFGRGGEQEDGGARSAGAAGPAAHERGATRRRVGHGELEGDASRRRHPGRSRGLHRRRVRGPSLRRACGALGADADRYKYKYIIAVTVSLASVLELLDTSIVNVAIPHMMGNLGATLDEIAWVSTGYIVANVIILPITGWLSAFFGRRRYFAGSIAIFVVSSFFCGNAHS